MRMVDDLISSSSIFNAIYYLNPLFLNFPAHYYRHSSSYTIIPHLLLSKLDEAVGDFHILLLLSECKTDH